MPMYEFKCNNCGDEFEELILQSNAQVICPGCRSDKVTKKFSTFASNAVKTDSACSTCKPSSGFS